MFLDACSKRERLRESRNNCSLLSQVLSSSSGRKENIRKQHRAAAAEKAKIIVSVVELPVASAVRAKSGQIERCQIRRVGQTIIIGRTEDIE